MRIGRSFTTVNTSGKLWISWSLSLGYLLLSEICIVEVFEKFEI